MGINFIQGEERKSVRERGLMEGEERDSYQGFTPNIFYPNIKVKFRNEKEKPCARFDSNFSAHFTNVATDKAIAI